MRELLSAAQTSHIGSFSPKKWRALAAIKARLTKIKNEISAAALDNAQASSTDKAKAFAAATTALWRNVGEVYLSLNKISDNNKKHNALRDLRRLAARSLESYERNITPYQAKLYNMLLFDPAQVKERLAGKSLAAWPELSHDTCAAGCVFSRRPCDFGVLLLFFPFYCLLCFFTG